MKPQLISLEREILVALIVGGKHFSTGMQRCSGSKRWRPSQPLEEGRFEASVDLEEEVLKALIVEDENSLAHKATMQ